LYTTCSPHVLQKRRASDKDLPVQLVRTHQTHPSKAPIIVEAKMINASAAFVAWNPLDEDNHNGALLGYKVSQGQLYVLGS
jgi:hypothetical protein